jgi:WD40 repeat protein
LAFTADGKELLSGSWDGTVKRWPVPARLSEGRFGPWLEVHTGHRLDDPGILVPLDIESWTKRVESLAPTPMR